MQSLWFLAIISGMPRPRTKTDRDKKTGLTGATGCDWVRPGATRCDWVRPSRLLVCYVNVNVLWDGFVERFFPFLAGSAGSRRSRVFKEHITHSF
jgi:hypothetical protein